MNCKRKLTEQELKDILSVIKVYRYLPKDIGQNICLNIRKNLENQLKDTVLYPEAIPKLKSIILDNYNRALLQPGEMVGTIAASSIGESTTQSSLNSVSWDSRTVIYKNINSTWSSFNVKIGEMIDKFLSKKPYKIVSYKGTNENGTSNPFAHVYDIPKNEEYRIMSVDENGKTSYQKITQLIRHPLYTKLLKVTTKSGRTIEATSGMSFLTRKGIKLIETLGSDLIVGDKIPVLSDIKDNPEMIINYINFRTWFSPKEYLYGKDLFKAKEIRDRYIELQKLSDKAINKCRNGDYRVKWIKHHGKDFILPYSRIHSFLHTINTNNKTTEERKIKPDCLYMKVRATDVSHIPEEFPLDNLFGFLVGCYVSYGWVDARTVIFNYKNSNMFNRLKDFCNLYNISIRKCNSSKKIYIYNTILCRLIKKICNTTSSKKTLPGFIYNSNHTFLKGFFDGLFSYKSSFSCKKENNEIENNYMIYKTKRKELATSIGLALSRIGVFVHFGITKSKGYIKNTLIISNEQLQIYSKYMNGYISNQDTINIFESFLNKEFCFYINKKLDMIDSLLFSNVYMDEIVKIVDITGTQLNTKLKSSSSNLESSSSNLESSSSNLETSSSNLETSSSNKYVYDFTVENTANFCSNGILMRDSFHTSGTNKANLTGGLVRQQELLNASKNVKTPSCSIYLKDINIIIYVILHIINGNEKYEIYS